MTAKEPRPGSYLKFNPSSQPTLQAPGQLLVPLAIAPPEVMGFQQQPGNVDAAEQEVVDRVADKLQAFYDGLPEDEQSVVTALMGQAAAHGWSRSD
jgi:hypothetical protein